jgi:hypothetical protein
VIIELPQLGQLLGVGDAAEGLEVAYCQASWGVLPCKLRVGDRLSRWTAIITSPPNTWSTSSALAVARTWRPRFGFDAAPWHSAEVSKAPRSDVACPSLAQHSANSATVNMSLLSMHNTRACGRSPPPRPGHA